MLAHRAARMLLYPLYRLLEHPWGYALNQRIGRPTTERYRELVVRNVPPSPARLVLDIGCGVGGFRDCFHGDYFGIDINQDYVRDASNRHPGRYSAMDATQLGFRDASFDDVVSIATTHHLDDDQVVGLVREASRVCKPGGIVHIVDAILPMSPILLFKRTWFRLDRGAYPRALEHILRLATHGGRILRHETKMGPLHDVVYLAIAGGPSA